MSTGWGPREEIASLADELVAARFEAYPIEASLLGLPGPHHRLTDYSVQGRQRTKNAVLAIARAATAVDPTVLTEQERITRELIVQQAMALVAEIDVRSEEFSVSDGLSSPALWPLIALPIITLTDGELAEGYLERLAALPRYLEMVAARQRSGIEHGLAPPGFLVRAGIAYVERYLGSRQDPLGAVTAQEPVSGFEERRDKLVADVVRPAYARYRQFLVDELLPAARPDGQAGLWWQPEGETRYAALIRVHTTTERSADELHQSGLAILDKLNAEYAALGKKVFGTSSIEDIFHRLRSDPALRWADGGEMLHAARQAIARAEQAVPSWFGQVPTDRIEVRPVPAAEASGGSTAYYTAPPLDGSRPGIYYLNVTDAPQRYRYLAEAIAFHEAIPGHHFQVTTARGLSELPLLRRIAVVNAYDEGWAVYAERLADEMGLYTDDVSRLGMLVQDSMRAARLVVDTGLHAKGWSRERAVGFLRERTPMAPLEIEAEVDRYAAVPAQALSYMVGRLEIQRMRAGAQAVLGKRFDIRAFHDVVLGAGPLPMSILDRVVQEWATGLA
jgi:uncharacterized protein (DUF885 family)